ncbi:alpha/beta fold hydrolase [Actinokineospora enzanensis]|uniref:alpha/beta fold hydrolase n=1 Tax=Actinokineospora enzanensis TaxID=155975 RepID=UPI001B7FD054|nr:alpha/beta hydrolase [Actinokineospora enzanensis]
MAEVSEVAARIATAVADVAPLLGALGDSVRVVLDERAQPVLDEMTALLGVPSVHVVPAAELGVAETVITRRLARAPLTAPLPLGAFDAVLTLLPRPITVQAVDGAPLRCYVEGPVGAPAVALVNACGMPVGLVSRWVRQLARRYRVVTWESRGMFGSGLRLDFEHDLGAQAADLVAVLDWFDLRDAHVLGLCGGAAIALAGAAASTRVGSLSLWHGDYHLGYATPRTERQRELVALLSMAGQNRERAVAVQRDFVTTVDTLRPDIAHHLYYPYATPELLHRYGRLHGAVMTTDCAPLLSSVRQPTLVVTSHDDTTAHPHASQEIATRLRRAHLHRLPHGDQLTAYDAAPPLLDLATGFIAATVAWWFRSPRSPPRTRPPTPR